MQSDDRLLESLLVVRAQDGEEAAFRALFEHINPRLLAYAARIMGDRAAAADAVQDAWLAIIRRIGKLHDPMAFRPWAYRIVTNKCLDRGRKMRMEKDMGEVLRIDTENTAIDESAGIERRLTVSSLINRLPPDRRALMALFYVEGLSIGEMAGIFGIAEGTVKSRLHATREALRMEMETGKGDIS